MRDRERELQRERERGKEGMRDIERDNWRERRVKVEIHREGTDREK